MKKNLKIMYHDHGILTNKDREEATIRHVLEAVKASKAPDLSLTLRHAAKLKDFDIHVIIEYTKYAQYPIYKSDPYLTETQYIVIYFLYNFIKKIEDEYTAFRTYEAKEYNLDNEYRNLLLVNPGKVPMHFKRIPGIMIADYVDSINEENKFWSLPEYIKKWAILFPAPKDPIERAIMHINLPRVRQYFLNVNARFDAKQAKY